MFTCKLQQADGTSAAGDHARRPEHAGRRHDPDPPGRHVPGRRSWGRRRADADGRVGHVPNGRGVNGV
jgi:hypothetical protein